MTQYKELLKSFDNVRVLSNHILGATTSKVIDGLKKKLMYF